MRIYLAARYSRRLELCGYREQLQELGAEITSRWLNGDHQLSDAGVPIGESGEALVEGPRLRDGETFSGRDVSPKAVALRERFALDDVEDVVAAEWLISFTEEPRTKANRGGRHVEHGIALGLIWARRLNENLHYFGPGMNRIIVVGPRENIFHWLPGVERYATWPECLTAITPDIERGTRALASWETGGTSVTVTDTEGAA